MNEPQPLTRYWICVEEPKGTDKWAIIREVKAPTPEAALLEAYEKWPEQGPFEVIPVHAPIRPPSDIADLLKL